MKILILSDSFPPESKGGAEVVVFKLAKGLRKFGEQIYIITTTQEKSQVGHFDYQGLTVFRIYADYHERWRAYLSLYNPQTVSRVKVIIKQIQPDIIHIHNIHYYLSYHCFKIAKKYSQAVFLTAHDVMSFHYGKLVEFINFNDLSIPKSFNYRIAPWQQIKRFKKRYNPLRNIIIRHYLKYIDKIFAVSYTLRNALNQNNIENVEVIHNGVDTAQWQVNSDKLKNFKKKYNLFNKKIIFFGGRLSDWKGGGKILRAVEIAAKHLPELVLLVAGKKDNYAQRMLEIAKNQGLRLTLTGWLEEDELKAAYFCSDIAVTPSLCLDTFNMINLEAMACQKPVVGTCFGGTPEIIVNSQTGCIVNPLNIQTMAEKIIDLLSNPSKAKQFGANGFQRVKNNFSLKKQIFKTLKWYREYVEK